MKDGFVKVSAISPKVRVADPDYNVKKIIEYIEKEYRKGSKILVFPELSITAYTCGDLFLQNRLIKEALKALDKIVEITVGKKVLVFVGFPFRHKAKLYNTAVAINDGKILAIIPKTFIPNYSEFYEKRYFTGAKNKENEYIEILNQRAVFGTKLIFQTGAVENLRVSITIELPIPGVKTDFFRNFFAQQSGDAFGFFNALTGGSFESLSILALSITPYITSSIIIQLMTIAIPKLEEMQNDGEEGRKKIIEYTRYVTVALAFIESIAMAIGFGRQGLINNFGIKSVVVVVVTMTAGSAFLMWIGERITEKGVGNGISVVLLFNILSSLPQDLVVLYTRFIANKTVAVKVVIGLIIIAAILAMVVFVIVLNDAERRIPVQYSAKTQGRKMVGGQSSNIPLKVNTANVMPVIFASSIMSFPVVISQFFAVNPNTVWGKILAVLNSSNWFVPERPKYSIGVIIYVALVIIFAYFYTSITFNPLEIADNMKKQGGFIPGIRPGKPTSDYLTNILNYIIFIGACGLLVVAIIPIILSGIFTVSRLSFSGTSLIIIAGVILETLKAIEAQMLVRNYRGFLVN